MFMDAGLGQLDIRRGGRARLTLLSAEKGSGDNEPIKVGAPLGAPIELQFNPKEYSVSGGATYDQQGSQDGGLGQYQGTKPYTTSLEVFIDEPSLKTMSPSTPSLEKQVDTLLQAVQKAKNKDHPPVLEFSWGSRSFQALATQVAVKFSMFNNNGDPIRATCTLTLTILPSTWPKQNPTSGTPRIDRAHQVTLGDSLASISYDNYGDPTMWRAIAEANAINDPSRLPQGEYLTVPARTDAERLA